MSKFFINRPNFAWVVAIFIMLVTVRYNEMFRNPW